MPLQRLSDDRPYLCGDRFTAADLTFAALAASVLMPPSTGALPQPEGCRWQWRRSCGSFARTAGAHALAMFRDERSARLFHGAAGLIL
jgi:glutathione S-transferase